MQEPLPDLLIIDRFEGELAICETLQRTRFTLPRSQLPSGVREGDCLQPLPEGGWAVDEEETRRRRERNRALFEKLRKQREP